MSTKATLLLAAVLAAGSAAQAGAQQVNPRNPSDSRAFDVMETDQGPPTAADRLYAKPKHKKHGKKHRSADTQPYDSTTSSMGASGAAGVTGSGTEVPPPVTQDVPGQPDRETPPGEPRIER
ncbi:hypothetical protein GCM10027277_42800 [Pseudoduganella ginsengisoli]|uniref:Uncharacterized protein n=1 Tax=Pseudoduganella ginsengisoli TaxID=1462440 RepID=A0A6L6Q6H9_9BURK|nr:hypothetical protein [Pseudoduganella ginsengisoli]MTW05116.1 hypothetical protein [Pseudoduganella ginsengisoli]